MRTISKSDIERSVELLNNLTDNKRKFGIEYSCGGCRLTSNNGSVNISERGTKRETNIFIRGYIRGVERELLTTFDGSLRVYKFSNK